ncbi:pirin family protein [Persicitalea jodogahamensis]|uniref:Quercetin 2,3-dioxygenase C-terminal cupin domain-containing protein n=1 Tax=Persicitalea jodogahamensis TaxID=402147 RepID=A0A8J3D2V7_9BACT|nr:hypothetical protein [Persicitalea jodogahamensis]GHB61564.1 hypothetical protein GCM10007390_14300 [Persicitalea jodogahamensis]
MKHLPVSETVPATEARIFPATRRAGAQTPYSLQFQTNITNTFSGSDTLQKISDDTLRAGIELSMLADTDSVVVLLPYIGDLQVTNQDQTVRTLLEGQVFTWPVAQGGSYHLRNTYQEEAINFFQIVFSDPFPKTVHCNPTEYHPALAGTVIMEERPNEMLSIFEKGQKISIGKYDGRAEGIFQVQNPAQGVFAFIIEGAFEVQNRLLEARDGLVLQNVNEVEFEALSQDAVLVLIEL